MARSDTLPSAPVLTQALGQPGTKHGLREGAPALKRARVAYLSMEWSGEDDRRPPAGLIRRERV